MDEQTRRYEPQEDAVELGDVLEPYEPQETYDEPYPAQDEAYYDEPYLEDGAEYIDEYSDEHEAIDIEGRFKVAMGVFDTVSILVGILVILALVAILMTLINWLRTDILHSALLLQSGLQ